MSKRKHPEGASGYENIPPRSPFTTTLDLTQKGDAIHQLAKDVYLSSTYSDLTIICKIVVFHAHKFIVCPQSGYFKAACSSGFKESKEPVRLPDTEPAWMKKVLEYLYTGKYTFDFQRANGSITFNTSSLHLAGVGQSGSMPQATLNAGASEPVACVQQSLIAATGTNPRGPLTSMSSTQTSPKGTSSSINVAGERPSEPSSQDMFVAYCLTNPAYFHVRMYAEADYFMIDNLKPAAIGAFRKALSKYAQKKTRGDNAEALLHSSELPTPPRSRSPDHSGTRAP